MPVIPADPPSSSFTLCKVLFFQLILGSPPPPISPSSGDTQATAQRDAVLAQHRTGGASPSYQATFRRTGRRCCGWLSPRLGSKCTHAFVLTGTFLLLLLTVAMTIVYNAEVWVSCTGPDAGNLTATHPVFCDGANTTEHHHGHHGHHGHDDDHHHQPRCGNEMFAFNGWRSVTYTTATTATELSWTAILALGAAPLFPKSIGTFHGNSTIFTETDTGLGKLGHLARWTLFVGILAFVATLVVTKATFFGLRRLDSGEMIETPRRWAKLAAVFVLTLVTLCWFAFAGATLPIVRPALMDRHGSHGSHYDDEDWHVPAWSQYYEPSFGCVATPKLNSMVLVITAMHTVGYVLFAIILRSCFLRCKSRDLGAAQVEWQARRSASNPAVAPFHAIPPPYNTFGFGAGATSIQDEKPTSEKQKLVDSSSVV